MASSSAVSAGDTILASHYNNLRTDTLNTAARVTQATGQSFAHSTIATVAFGAETFDTGSYHDNSTDNSRLTTATAGIYLIGANVPALSGGMASFAMAFERNGVSLSDYGNRGTTGGDPTQYPNGVQATFIYQAGAGDYFELLCTQHQASGTGAVTVTDISFWIAQIAVI
jgi:hypothetical protein